MSRTPLFIFFCLACSHSLLAQDVTGWLRGDQSVVISGSKVELLGLDLKSAGGFLVPIPNNDPAPFSFLLENISTQITYASLSDAVLLDGEIVLSARYVGPESTRADDLVGEWGGPVLDGMINFQQTPQVPEPASNLLLIFGSLMLLGFRHSKSVRRDP